MNQAAGLGFDPYLSYQTGPFQDSPPIPNHWHNLPNLVLFDERNERGYDELPVFSVTQDRGVVRQDSLEYSVAEASKDRSSYKRIRNGDLVYNKMRMWQGAVGRATADGIVSPAYVVLKPKETVDSRFFAYFYRSSVGLVQSNRLSYGIVDDQNSLRCSDFLSGRSPVPPRQEQVLIADFLDRQTSRINDLIARKERLIELLEEKRTALITQAVTKGLDPDVPMKDSGVEWLGEIPEHWDVRELKYCTDPEVPVSYGILKPGRNVTGGVPYLGAGEIGRGRLTPDELPRTTQEIAASYPRTCLESGELVYAIRGSYGAVAVVPPELEGANLSRDAARIAPAKQISSDWMRRALQSQFTQAQFESVATGAAVTGVNIRDLREVWLPVPPYEEQNKIAAHLDEQLRAIQRARERMGAAVDLLGEYRSALITAAVTGKIDVRDHAA